METWFLNHVLGLSLLLLLGLPRPLGAGTPGRNSTDPGSYHSTSAVEVSSVEDTATSSSYSSESLSPSQRNLLTLTAAAAGGNLDTEETQTFTETSRSLKISLSTEPLPSTPLVATAEASSSGSTRSNSSSSSSTSSGSSSSSSGTSSGSSSTSSTSVSSSSSSDTSSGSSSSSSSTSVSGSSSSDTSSGSSSSSSSTSGSSSSTSVSSSSNSDTSSGTSSSSSTSDHSSGSSTSGSSSSTSVSSSSSSDTSSGTSSSSSTSGRSSSSTSGGSSSSSGTSSGSSRSSSSSRGTSSGSSTSGSGSGSSSSSGTSSSGWKDLGITDLVPGVSQSVSWKARSWTLTEETSLPQDNPDTTLQLQDATALASQTAILTDSTYTSSAISRAGERTLLSVTSSSGNSTSSAFTEDSNSHQPPSTWGVPAQAKETEDYTHSAPSTQTDSRDTTDEHMTMFSETGSPEESRGTPSLTEPPNATWHQHTSETEETSDSTTPLRGTELSTDQSDVLVSSTPPVTSPAGGPTNVSGTELETGSDVGTSTEALQSFSTLNQEGTKGLSSQTREESIGPGLTTEPPTVRSNTHDMDDSLTNTPVLVTEISFNTTQVPVTERSQTTDTFKAFTSSTISTTIAPLPTTSSSHFSSTSSSSTSELLTKATIPYTTPPTTAFTPGLQTSAVHTTLSTSSSPSTESAIPTNGTTLQIETGTLGGTTSHNQYATTPNTHSTPTRSTEVLHTTGRQSGRGTTELVVTTSPADIQPTRAPPPPPRDPCVSNPCMNGGMCVSYKRHPFTCHCQQAWTGPTCNQDMDECERDPCPVGSRCVNTRGSFSCECALGFDLEDGRTCTRAKTFLGTFSFNRLPQDPVIFKSSTMHEIQREIIQLLNASLSVLQGYSRSTLTKKEEDGVRIFAVNMFSISTDVTSAEVYNSIQMSLSNCSSSTAHCRMVLHHQLTYHVESLCLAQKPQCDTLRSMCTDSGGTAYCQCLQGYYKHNPEDLTCLECGDGNKLENGTCVPCMFGFGGFNCGNFYKLIAVVVSPTGGAMLLILIIALIVTCCRKDKNDINKIIFKSGDLQMSPYADFPKNNRISMEWGRETIEMQENGSTKNLLQMTDIYYSPALRNSDLERNGLYPFTGLPGSRHSCIYPAQWNPSFISDDSRRRDYF